MPSRWDDLSRPPLSAARLQRALGGSVWREVRVVEVTGSTNADVAQAAHDGAAEGLIMVAEQQTAGRGRLDRQWESPPRAAVLLSGLLRPSSEPSTWPLLSLVAGLAVVEAVAAVGRVEAALKWPNDVIVGDRKLAGVLAERVDDGVVVGIGLNVSTRAEELPVDTATSLLLVGGVTDREPLVKEILRALARRYVAWREAGGNPGAVVPAYRDRCETIGRLIEIRLPGGEVTRGTAIAVDDGGHLVVADEASGIERTWSVGDVIHVRRVS